MTSQSALLFMDKERMSLISCKSFKLHKITGESHLKSTAKSSKSAM